MEYNSLMEGIVKDVERAIGDKGQVCPSESDMNLGSKNYGYRGLEKDQTYYD